MASAERREQILACALRVTAEQGLGNARHSDVARLAGVAVPTVFHYFPTRADLTTGVLAEVRRFLLDELVGPRLGSRLPAADAVLSTLLAFAGAIDAERDHVRIWLDWSTAIRAAYWPAYLDFHAEAMRRIGRMIDDGKHAGTLPDRTATPDQARVIIGLAHVIAHMKFAGDDQATIARTVNSVVTEYLGPGTRARHRP